MDERLAKVQSDYDDWLAEEERETLLQNYLTTGVDTTCLLVYAFLSCK